MLIQMGINENRTFIIVIAVVVFLLDSCTPNCKQETIAKPEWITRFESYKIDTLLNYIVTDNRVEVIKSQHSGNRDVLNHSVTIQNANNRYSNTFSVRFYFKCWSYYGNSRWDNWEETQTYEIEPNSTHTFTKKWYAGEYGNSDANWFNNKAEISQNPKTIKLIRRVDEMILKDTTLNNCECDVDALKAEYKAIQNMYQKVKNENLIRER